MYTQQILLQTQQKQCELFVVLKKTKPFLSHVAVSHVAVLAVRGDSGAGGLVAPLPCTAYFGKLAKLFGCSLPQQALA